MRKTILTFLSITFILLTSCTVDNETNAKMPSVKAYTRSDLSHISIYDYHYKGLEFAYQHIEEKPLPSIQGIVQNFKFKFDDYRPIEVNWSKLDSIVRDQTNLSFYTSTSISKLYNSNAVNSIKSEKIQNLLFEIESIQLTTAYRDRIIEKIEEEDDIEIRSGFELLLSSYDYWLTEVTYNDDDVHAIQLDAAGYIIGWVDAVIDDYNNGILIPERQWIRMRKAATFGLGCSVGKWCR